MRRWIPSIAVAIAASGLAAHAHHSIAGVYDSSKQVTMEGTVAKFQLVNPHPFLLVDVDGGGRDQQWRLEMDNRHELVALGITPNTFRPGDRVLVSGSLARAHRYSLYVLRLDRPADGFRYEQVGQTPRISRR
jgi:hypothetical protein